MYVYIYACMYVRVCMYVYIYDYIHIFVDSFCHVMLELRCVCRFVCSFIHVVLIHREDKTSTGQMDMHAYMRVCVYMYMYIYTVTNVI